MIKQVLMVLVVLMGMGGAAWANGGTPQADEHASPVADDNASDEGMAEALCKAA